MRDASKRQWMRAITTTNDLTAHTRLALLAIAEKHMLSDGTLVIGVEKLAGGRDDKAALRRYARYFQQAYEKRWLRQTSPGYRGHAATYVAVIPDAGEAQVRRPKKGAMTDIACQSLEAGLTDITKQSLPPKKTDTCMSVQEEVERDQREHVAVPSNRPTATAPRREEPARLIPGEYRGGPVVWDEAAGA